MGTLGWSRSLRQVGAVSGRTALAVAVGVCVAIASPAHAATVLFSATIDEAQETPPNGSLGTGTGTFVMDTVANTLSVSVTYSGLGSATIAGHIHGFAGPGFAAGVVFGFPAPNSPINEVWNFMQSQEADIIAGLTYVNIHSMNFPAGEIRGQILRTPSCGDGILDGGETCDDGNTVNGDCCSSTCQLDPATTPCGDGLCLSGTCDGAGNCGGTGEPRGDCRTAAKSLLLIKNDADDDTKDKLIFKWIKGAATTVEDFGTPAGTTSYAVCLYAGTTDTSIGVATIAPNMTFWTATTPGFKYKDPGGTSSGIQKVLLKSGAAGKAKTLVKGKGGGLPDPPAGPLPLPVTAQLVNNFNNVCYEGIFNNIKKNDLEQFKAKNP